MFGKKQNPDLEEFAKILADSIVSLFQEQSDIKFSQEPQLVKKNILEYNGRMRADGLEKFNNPTYVATVNYYLNARDMEKDNTIGALVIFVEQAYIPTLVKLLKYPPIDDEDEEVMKDSCGTLSNIIAGRYKTEIVNNGYAELEMSPFLTYRNSASAGVNFCFSEYNKYEINFYIKKIKRLVIEVSIGIVPRR